MKTVVNIIAILIVTSTLSAFAKASGIAPHNRHKNQFVLRTDRDMLGAKVDVLSESGDSITSQRLMKTKMVIDFTGLPAGHYTIVVKKDDYIESFTYTRYWR